MKDGLKILFNTYWDSKGWKDGTVSEDDFNLAKSQGYMFDYPKVISHDDTLKKLKKVVKQINPNDIVNAFLYSLTTRKLEYRSAFGSYWYAISIPNHQLYLKNNSLNHNHCYLCGWYKWADNPTDYALKHGVNVYNFERYKFGGVRHTRLDYALFDLEQFLKLPKVTGAHPAKEEEFAPSTATKEIHTAKTKRTRAALNVFTFFLLSFIFLLPNTTLHFYGYYSIKKKIRFQARFYSHHL